MYTKNNTRCIKISIDAMGGEFAPRPIVEGIQLFFKRHQNASAVYFIIYGDQALIRESFGNSEIPSNITIIHTTEVVLDTDQPTKVLRNSSTSMYKAIESIKGDENAACISCGNTGALMVLSKMILGVLPHILRPAIAGILPNKNNGSILVDMGANTECSIEHLIQFTLMGISYAKNVLNKDNPSVGLLSVGTERNKGNDLYKKVYEALSSTPSVNFHGYVEGFALAEGNVDVIVADGFTGNIALKSAEGAVKLCVEYIKNSIQSNLRSKIGGMFLSASLKKYFSTLDPNKVSGAMFIGLNGIVVKSHGSSTAEAIYSAIALTYNLVYYNINKSINIEMDILTSNKHATLLEKIRKKFGLE